MRASDDQYWIKMATRLAREGLGRTGENPSVGCVITRETSQGIELIGRGRTGDGGTPHGEINALAMAGDAARSATLYVSLEPCSHHGKTPPCADVIIEAGISRVVVALHDPNPDVAGNGLQRMRDAGVKVDICAPDEEALWATAGHLLRVRENRPFVQLKLAVSSDGLIAPGDGDPVWVTGEAARNHAHLLRAQADAILVGRGTVEADDPGLDCRLPGLEKFSPHPCVFDTRLNIDPGAKLVRHSKTRPLAIFCAPHENAEIENRARALRDAGVNICEVAALADGKLAPRDALQFMAGQGITRLMIEGGPHVAASFLDAGLVDEVVIFRGTQSLEGKGLKPLGDAGLEQFDDEADWQAVSEISCGPDTMMVKRSRKTVVGLKATQAQE